jgi:ribosomal protein S3AE
LGATLRQSLVIPNAVNSREKKETNREALDRFDQVVVPLDEDNPTVGTRVVEVNMQELFTMMVSKMERMEMRVMNVLTKGLDALNARVSVLERRMNGM